MINFVTVATLAFTLLAGDSPSSYRVVILDCSGSMGVAESTGQEASRRIDVATEEIRGLARQLPPSPDHPIGLVLFNDSVRTQEFQSLPALETFLNDVEPDGGTAISLGLKGAHTLLQRASKSKAMFVLLYTDGENAEDDGERKVAEQEAALDHLFATRRDQGLATNVICRRWANANNDWVKSLKQKPHWGIVDAKDFRLHSVTATPVLAVVSATWVDDETLDVQLRGHARFSGPAGAIDQLSIRCTNGVVTGNPSVALPTGSEKPTHFNVATKLASLDANSGRGQLRFKLQNPMPRIVSGQAIVPAIDPHVSVSFDIPPRARTFSLTGQMKPLASRWLQPTKRQAVTDVELSLDVQSLDGSRRPWPTKIDFLIEPDKDIFLVAGSPVLRVSQEGISTTKISLATNVPEGMPEGKLAVRVIPQNGPAYITLNPKVVIVRTTFDLPTAARTVVTATPGPPVTGHWTDVGRDIALFEFPINVVVQGPTTDSAFTVVSPPTVHDIAFVPSRLHSGEQTIQVRMEVRCAAGQAESIRLEIVPPQATDVVKYDVTDSLDVGIIGPRPVRLVLADGQQVVDGLQIEIPDTMDTYEDSFTTALLGAASNMSTSGVRAKLSTTANLPFTISSTSRIGETVPFSARVPSDHKQNFWLDSRYEVAVQIEPDRPIQSIEGSTAVLHLVIPAPFKRWLFGLLLGVGAVALILGPVFAFRRFNSSDDGAD